LCSSIPDTLASSTTKTGRHDIAASGIKHNKSNQINTKELHKIVAPIKIKIVIFQPSV
jgi:hypothetical protein